MTAQPDISVIVPVHNVDLWVAECLSSILDDQDVDMEVIVVDDASTDDTWAIVQKFAAGDQRVVPVRSTGQGGAQARNLGVEHAHGEFIAFCDGDDLVPRGAYARMLTSARSNGADMVIGNFLKFWASRTWRPSWRWPAFEQDRVQITLSDAVSLIRNRACWNRLFRRSFWLDQRIEFPSVPRSNDIAPMTKALIAATSINVITDDVYLYRGRPGDSSMTAQAAGLDGFVSYLSQENVSSSLVDGVGDPKLRREYADLFLAADGWVHLCRFLELLDESDFGDDELALAHENFVAVLEALPPEACGDLPYEHRLVFSLVAAGHWSEAARLATSLTSAGTERPDATWYLEQSARLDETQMFSIKVLRTVVRRKVLSPLMEGEIPASAEIADTLASYSRVFQNAFPADVLTQQPIGAQQLIRALTSGDAAAIVSRLRMGLLGNVDVTGVGVARRRVRVQAGVATIGEVQHVGMFAIANDRRRDFPAVTISSDGRHVTGTIPVGSLGTGAWTLFFEVTDSIARVASPLDLPAEAVAKAGRSWNKVAIRPGDRARHGQVVVRPNVARRLVTKALQSIRR